MKPLFQMRWIGIILVFSMLIFACDTTNSVTPYQDQTFIKLYGGNGSEVGKDIIQLSDGGFVIVGSSTSGFVGGKDIYIVRTDKLGNLIWENRYDGKGGNDVGNSVILGDNNNIYVCGEISQQTSGFLVARRDVIVLDISIDNGTIQNEQVYGDSLRDEVGTDILKLDNGFFISATMDHPDTSKYFLIETDINLDTIQFRSRYIGTNNVNNYSTSSFENIADPNNPFVCFGTSFRLANNPTNSSYWYHAFTYKSNSNQPGIVEYYGSGSSDEFCTDIDQTIDGGFILSGYQTKGNVSSEMILKIDRNLQQVWSEPKIYPNQFNRSVKDCGIMQTRDRGYIVTSTIELDDPKNDEISLLRLNSEGEEQWRKTYGSNEDDTGSKVIELEDGSFVIVGTIGFDINPDSESKMCLIKINREGDLVPLK